MGNIGGLNYKTMKKIISLLFLFLPILAGCQEKKKPATRLTMDELIEINRQLVNDDDARIKTYIDEKKLQMQRTETGMWYNIQSKKKTPTAATGQIISLKYNVSLLDGTACYASDKKNPRTFRIGQGGVESGLEEAALMLRKGDKATFIMPPHLAYGLTGDNNRIPPRATIIYEVEVLDVRER
ncbi:gliding motility-associated peptidyl-prolyl isomerase [Breznakibacter xylanolyticus]|uniref:Peptidyl-prolyl cis-trans isomerase n=2 Tax=Breznakibacter xylanolyticus TaxID=990 RepID=A0A2W7NJN8_9BACT|nr:gliding motility-associated peptidyl-prolyl isomerase [Breznakibacter xylanolyticus]